MNHYLNKCLTDYSGKAEMLSLKNKELVSRVFETLFPIEWNHIEWDKLNASKQINKNDLIKELKKLESRKIFIIWDEATLPILKASPESTANLIDDLIYVSFNTWIFEPKTRAAIELYDHKEITMGNGKDMENELVAKHKIFSDKQWLAKQATDISDDILIVDTSIKNCAEKLINKTPLTLDEIDLLNKKIWGCPR